MLAKSKLNSIETLISQALIDLEISHEKFKTIFNKKEKYEKIIFLTSTKCLKLVLKHLLETAFTTQ